MSPINAVLSMTFSFGGTVKLGIRVVLLFGKNEFFQSD